MQMTHHSFKSILKSISAFFIVATCFALSTFFSSCDSSNEEGTSQVTNTVEEEPQMTQPAPTEKEEEVKEENNASMYGYKIGETVNGFTLPNPVSNQELVFNASQEAFQKGAIVVFTCNHCPYAKAYEQRIIDLHNEFAPKGYPVIAINPNDYTIEGYEEDSPENMVKRANEKGYPFPYLLDEHQEVYKEFGATKTPHVYVLENADAELVVRYIGAIDEDHENPGQVKNTYVADAVNALLNGQEVPVKTTKAVGCSIKDKNA